MNKSKIYKVTLTTAITIVMANMIGQGVFTSLGYQVIDLKSGFTILALWLIGGVLALFGSFAYGELGASLPRFGGEYNFLSRIYHPYIGFLAGWVSIMVGFAAPVATAGLAMGAYSGNILIQAGWVDGADEQAVRHVEKLIALGVVLVIGVVHLQNLKAISIFQQFFTIFKVLLIVFLILVGFIFAEGSGISFIPDREGVRAMISQPFAESLVWVMYAYSGWNAAAYMVEELKNPGRNLPRSLFIGTLIVTVLYVLLNAMFLYAAPVSKMAGIEDVGHVAAKYIFGDVGASIISGLIAFALISAISSMTWAGPRVSMAIGQDLKLFKFISVKNKNDIPHVAIYMQVGLTVIMILFSSFKDLVEYTGVLLSMFSFLAVMGVYVLRAKEPELTRPYKAWGYPVTPAIFLIITGWMIVFFIKNSPKQLIAILATLVLGTIIYFINELVKKNKQNGSKGDFGQK